MSAVKLSISNNYQGGIRSKIVLVSKHYSNIDGDQNIAPHQRNDKQVNMTIDHAPQTQITWVM